MTRKWETEDTRDRGWEISLRAWASNFVESPSTQMTHLHPWSLTPRTEIRWHILIRLSLKILIACPSQINLATALKTSLRTWMRETSRSFSSSPSQWAKDLKWMLMKSADTNSLNHLRTMWTETSSWKSQVRSEPDKDSKNTKLIRAQESRQTMVRYLTSELITQVKSIHNISIDQWLK